MESNIEINANETLIVGSWIMDNGKVIGDQACQRIDELTNNYLKKVDVGDWEILYQDPKDNRYWLLDFPHSEWHGGGPPTLKLMTLEEVTEKFELPK